MGKAFRAVILGVCLIGVPLAALLGTSLPETIRAKLAGPAPRVDNVAKGPCVPRAEPQTIHPSVPERIESPPRTSEPPAGAQSTTRRDPAVQPATVIDDPPAEPRRTPALQTPPQFVPQDRFLGVLQRLQEHGAVHYRLERSANEGGRFWFVCEVEGIRQPFEATDNDPVRAAESVVRQIEAWRANPR